MYRDFFGQNEKGYSLKSQSLEKAKFICVDIPGANFSGANLRG
ncbi:MAG: pentapeptide repeat-containing protein [Nostoc sp. EkiNYC01]|nr:pentapeptide repeat-containing protein [Nostoc sp. EkiNYC01]